jgi:hypothetical protein
MLLVVALVALLLAVLLLLVVVVVATMGQRARHHVSTGSALCVCFRLRSRTHCSAGTRSASCASMIGSRCAERRRRGKKRRARIAASRCVRLALRHVVAGSACCCLREVLTALRCVLALPDNSRASKRAPDRRDCGGACALARLGGGEHRVREARH